MRILIAAATDGEVAPLASALRFCGDAGANTKRYAHAGHDVDLLVTGVGMVATAAWCSRALAASPYDVAINAGLCGSFDRSLAPGTVVHVVADRIAELGAEDGDAFLTIYQLGLLDANAFPFTGGRLVNADPPASARLKSLRAVEAITVNTVHGSERSIAACVERFDPRVESMEGAAFMYACLVQRVRFAQVRAVSNVVERRNRAAWKIADAIDALGAAVFGIVETL
jgi:futalosine hydrolase